MTIRTLQIQITEDAESGLLEAQVRNAAEFTPVMLTQASAAILRCIPPEVRDLLASEKPKHNPVTRE